MAAEAARMEYLSRAQSVVRESAGGGGAGGGGGWAAQRDGGAYSGLLAGERYLTHPALVSSSVPLPSGVGMGMTTRDGPSTTSLPRRLCGVADSTCGFYLGILTPGGRLSEAAVPAPPAPPDSGGLTMGSYGPYGGNALPVDTPGVGVSATDSSGTVTDVNNLVRHSTKTRHANLGFA